MELLESKSRLKFLCSTYGKMFGNKFVRLSFLLGRAFGHTPGIT